MTPPGSLMTRSRRSGPGNKEPGAGITGSQPFLRGRHRRSVDPIGAGGVAGGFRPGIRELPGRRKRGRTGQDRSEERRVGKEWRCRGAPDHEEKKENRRKSGNERESR